VPLSLIITSVCFFTTTLDQGNMESSRGGPLKMSVFFYFPIGGSSDFQHLQCHTGFSSNFGLYIGPLIYERKTLLIPRGTARSHPPPPLSDTRPCGNHSNAYIVSIHWLSSLPNFYPQSQSPWRCIVAPFPIICCLCIVLSPCLHLRQLPRRRPPPPRARRSKPSLSCLLIVPPRACHGSTAASSRLLQLLKKV
jgi:hypothetical protein